MMSPALSPASTIAPSSICHPAGTSSFRNPRKCSMEFPSNNNCQPCCFSSAVRLFSWPLEASVFVWSVEASVPSLFSFGVQLHPMTANSTKETIERITNDLFIVCGLTGWLCTNSARTSFRGRYQGHDIRAVWRQEALTRRQLSEIYLKCATTEWQSADKS